MLHSQYGIAASSSIVKVAHPEDSQPNEGIQGRNRQLPPKLNTVRPPRFDHIASSSSRLGPQLARRGSWNHRKPLPSRSRREWSKTSDDVSSRNATSSTCPTTAPQPSSLSSWIPRYRSISPKLPPEPIRRRTPQALGLLYQPADQQPSSSWPLPGRKRKASEAPSELPPTQKLKISSHEPTSPPSQLPIKPEPISPEPTRRLVYEACSFWPAPDNCQKSVSDHSENRKEFAKAKSKELSRLGLKRTKAFFRADGLVIEWRSEIPVWNDTLLPERRCSPSPKKSSSDSAGTDATSLKRKRDIVEVIDVDALPSESLPKKSRPADAESPQSDPSSRKGKRPVKPAKHWSVGLSKDEIRKLGRSVEAASLKHSPPPSTLTAPAVAPKKAPAFTQPAVTPTKRPPLPTRLTPSERKAVSSPYKKPISNVVVADRDTHASGLAVPASSNFTEDSNVVPLSHQSTDLSTNEMDTLPSVGKDMELPGDTFFSSALLERHAKVLSEVEAQEVQKLCTKDTSPDLAEYEMAEDFLRRFISLFDTDRNELEQAYSNDACLSCRVPDLQADPSGAPVPTSSTSTLHLGRAEIMDKLNGLIDYHFSPDSQLLYDIAVLSQEVFNSGSRDDNNSEAVGGILATLHSQIIRTSSGMPDHVMTIQHGFVLRRRTDLVQDDSGSNGSTSKHSEWPLMAVSHHIVLRDEPLLPPGSNGIPSCPSRRRSTSQVADLLAT